MSEGRTLVIFVKAPVAGRVKSRLARTMGAARAAAIYRTLTRTILRAISDPRWRTVLAVAPDDARGQTFAGLWPAGLARRGQGLGDLGERMGRVFRAAPPGPCVIVGSDCPAMTRAHIAAAFRALGRADAVVGPAEDGGYWLIGLKGAPRRPRIFEGVRWSTEHALADTLAGLPKEWRIARIDTLRDIDTEADWRAWSAGRGPSQRSWSAKAGHP
ncbi:MAG: DUF2064 domain-containing protein [Alphaproteobacteria bacterium]|nr:DUF2064 domain-containing protein [Alphaproteobacteria bacterium]